VGKREGEIEEKSERKEDVAQLSMLQLRTDALRRQGAEQRIGWLSVLNDQLMSAVDTACRMEGMDVMAIASDEESLALFIIQHHLTHLLSSA